MQGHIKDMRAKVEETQHKKPEPHSTNILQLLEEMKEVQCKIKQDVANPVELKAEIEAAVKKFQEEQHKIATMKKN